MGRIFENQNLRSLWGEGNVHFYPASLEVERCGLDIARDALALRNAHIQCPPSYKSELNLLLFFHYNRFGKENPTSAQLKIELVNGKGGGVDRRVGVRELQFHPLPLYCVLPILFLIFFVQISHIWVVSIFEFEILVSDLTLDLFSSPKPFSCFLVGICSMYVCVCVHFFSSPRERETTQWGAKHMLFGLQLFPHS